MNDIIIPKQRHLPQRQCGYDPLLRRLRYNKLDLMVEFFSLAWWYAILQWELANSIKYL